MLTRDDIKTDLGAFIAEAMYMDLDEIEADQLFSDFGLESVTLVKVIGKLCEKHSCSIKIRDLLPYQTLDEASDFIYKKLLE